MMKGPDALGSGDSRRQPPGDLVFFFQTRGIMEGVGCVSAGKGASLEPVGPALPSAVSCKGSNKIHMKKARHQSKEVIVPVSFR